MWASVVWDPLELRAIRVTDSDAASSRRGGLLSGRSIVARGHGKRTPWCRHSDALQTCRHLRRQEAHVVERAGLRRTAVGTRRAIPRQSRARPGGRLLAIALRVRGGRHARRRLPPGYRRTNRRAPGERSSGLKRIEQRLPSAAGCLRVARADDEFDRIEDSEATPTAFHPARVVVSRGLETRVGGNRTRRRRRSRQSSP